MTDVVNLKQPEAEPPEAPERQLKKSGAKRAQHKHAHDAHEMPPVEIYQCEEVFISHRNTPEDNRVADALSAALKRRGLAVWYDRQSLNAGTTYRGEITTALRDARIVVVLFPKRPSDWVIYEAACAHNDHKLLPIMLSDRKLPSPFSNVHAERVPDVDDPVALAHSVEMIADRCMRMIRGNPRARQIEHTYISFCRWLNRQFRSGAVLLYLGIASLITFLADVTNENNLLEVLHHAHLVLGMVVLGGLVFIPFGFAHSLAARSYRARQFGFETNEKLFWIWFGVMVIQPFLGLAMTWQDGTGPDSPGLEWHTPWIAASLIVYLLAMITALLGYFQARLAAMADEAQNGRLFIVHRARSLGMFFISFALTVAIVNLMLFKDRLF